jgi:5'-phosphate synthase pdxT subunit
VILQKLGLPSKSVKNKSDLDVIDGLIIPGGESTTMSLLIKDNDLFLPIKNFGKAKPVMGTCAGLILMSKYCNDEKVNPFGFLNLHISRNAYGRQISSKKEKVNFNFGEKKPLKITTTLIRAPKIIKYDKKSIVLGKLNSDPVAILSNHFLGLTFHPELNGIKIFHEVLFDIKSKYFYKNIIKKL